ncbi:hypothetical protein ACWGM0_10640 [Sphingomonas bisphenolicum]
MTILAPLKLSKKDMRHTITIRIVGLRRFRIRARLLTALLRIAGWVSPVPVVVDTSEEPTGRCPICPGL